MRAPIEEMTITADAVATLTQLNKPVLQRGSQGPTVLELQRLLSYWGTYPGPFHGVFDFLVENAVKAYQHRVFLFEDGIVGQLTWQALYSGAPVNMPVLQRGSYGQAVITLQTVLRIAGDYQGVIDGDFGPITETAVRNFQRRFGLPVDGVVGDRTWHALSKVPH